MNMLEQDDMDDVCLTHSRLRHLRLGQLRKTGDIIGGFDTNAHILRHLTLPALETLLISVLDIPDAELDSSAPLQSLQVGVCFGDAEHRFLRRVSSLRDLTLDFRDAREPCITALNTMATDQNFLPNLQNLNVYSWDNDGHEVFIIALTARRASYRPQLQSFRIIFAYEGRPDDNILRALRRFAESGMHIHVGPFEPNYI
ncbi:hypothetical protein MVEN_00337400 [Mycena venus]|uniref:Uncharacterized protein n=1 Tax=Mycena venus TaxID=2733690 RepID=A0A8H7DAA9_9AGAR|nr:hypothetical protein MVEN_00337400 [Mycena venus]